MAEWIIPTPLVQWPNFNMEQTYGRVLYQKIYILLAFIRQCGNVPTKYKMCFKSTLPNDYTSYKSSHNREKIMCKWYKTKRLKKYMEHTSHYCLDNAWIVYNFCLSDKAYHASCSCHSPSVIDLILLTVLYVWHQLWCVLLPTDSHYDNIIQYTKEQSFCEYFPCRNEWEWDSNPIQANNSCLLPCSWET